MWHPGTIFYHLNILTFIIFSVISAACWFSILACHFITQLTVTYVPKTWWLGDTINYNQETGWLVPSHQCCHCHWHQTLCRHTHFLGNRYCSCCQVTWVTSSFMTDCGSSSPHLICYKMVALVTMRRSRVRQGIAVKKNGVQHSKGPCKNYLPVGLTAATATLRTRASCHTTLRPLNEMQKKTVH